MVNRLKLINWLLVLDVAICIPTHRLALSQSKKSGVSTSVAGLFRTTIIGFFLLFMMCVAGLAVYEWKKVSTEPGSMEKIPPFPKVSFVAAMIATALFTVYWTI